MTRSGSRRLVRITLGLLVLAAIFSAATLVARQMKEKATSPEFERLKTLVGSWKGTDPEGKPILVSYKLVSEGTAVLEMLGSEGHAESMVTMYHPDHGGLMLTHYCSMGNQPRMKLDPAKGSDSTLVFAFLDVTNMESSDEPHIHGLTIIFRDETHFAQQWVSMASGKERKETFAYERVK